MSATRYSDGTVEVEAVQFLGRASLDDVRAFLGAEPGVMERPYNDSLRIPTAGGDYACHTGDWILRGPAGELSVVRPHVFDSQYREVT